MVRPSQKLVSLEDVRASGIYIYGEVNYRGVCAHEDKEQEAFFQELRLKHPGLALRAFAPINEGKLQGGSWEDRKLKMKGKVSGISDIVISGLPTALIEMKRRDHTQSKFPLHQLECLLAAKQDGAFVAYALGAEAAMKAVQRWLSHSQKLQEVLQSHGLTKENGYAVGRRPKQTALAHQPLAPR